MNFNKQVPILSSITPGITHPFNANTRAILNARWDMHGYRPLNAESTGTLTFFTYTLKYFPPSTTFGAREDGLAKENTGFLPKLSATVAVGTSTRNAWFCMGKFYLAIEPGNRILRPDLNVKE
jgi:hypothetical protein